MLPLTVQKEKTLAEWRIKIIKSLGGANWNVELAEEDIDHALYQTQILFGKYRPEIMHHALGTVMGENIPFNLKDVIPDGARVSNVSFQRNAAKVSRPFSRYPLVNSTFSNTREPRMIYQKFQAQDRHNSFMGTQPMWRWVPETKTLHVSSISYETNATAIILMPFSLEKIPFDQEYDFLQGAVAHAKIILARRYLKFGGEIPSAQGTIRLDGDALRSEGETTIKELEQRLDRNLRHLPPQPIYS